MKEGLIQALYLAISPWKRISSAGSKRSMLSYSGGRITSSLTLGLPFLPSSPLWVVSVTASYLLAMDELYLEKFRFLVKPRV